MTSTTPSTEPAQPATGAAQTPHKFQPTRVSDQRLARTAGVMYLVTIVASIPAQFVLYHPVLSNPEYVLGAGHDTRVMWGGLLELITALACIGTAVALFPVVRRHHEAAALGFVTARVLEAALIVTGLVSMLAVTTLRQPDATGTEATSLVAVADALVAVHDWTFLLGPGIFPGINALLLGYLMYRSGLVPRIIPRIGLIGAPFFLAAAGATIVGVNEPASVVTALVTLPIFAWEAALGVRLTISGVNRPTPTSTT
jgi:hypothetical protein